MEQKRYFVVVRERFAQLVLQETEQDGGFPSVPKQTAMLLVQQFKVGLRGISGDQILADPRPLCRLLRLPAI